jgi:hypothetical protein
MSVDAMEPIEGLRPPDQGPDDFDRPTRPKLKLWDRIKFIVLFIVVWFMLVWAAMATNPILPFVDAMRMQVQDAAWLLVLLGLEVARQAHFLVSERSAAYHAFWTNRVFGGSERSPSAGSATGPGTGWPGSSNGPSSSPCSSSWRVSSSRRRRFSPSFSCRHSSGRRCRSSSR